MTHAASKNTTSQSERWMETCFNENNLAAELSLTEKSFGKLDFLNNILEGQWPQRRSLYKCRIDDPSKVFSQ